MMEREGVSGAPVVDEDDRAVGEIAVEGAAASESTGDEARDAGLRDELADRPEIAAPGTRPPRSGYEMTRCRRPFGVRWIAVRDGMSYTRHLVRPAPCTGRVRGRVTIGRLARHGYARWGAAGRCGRSRAVGLGGPAPGPAERSGATPGGADTAYDVASSLQTRREALP
jgi:hypothetical protein